MLPKLVVPILGIVVLQAGLMCSTGFAATNSASLTVSVIVQAGCQVSPNGSVAESTVSGPGTWNSPVSVNCSLPVPYQVTVHSNRGSDLAGLSSTISTLADHSESAPEGDNNLLQQHDRVIRPLRASENGLVRPISLNSPIELINIAHCSADDTNPDTVTVTIIY